MTKAAGKFMGLLPVLDALAISQLLTAGNCVGWIQLWHRFCRKRWPLPGSRAARKTVHDVLGKDATFGGTTLMA
jgi:hypothetical protein